MCLEKASCFKLIVEVSGITECRKASHAALVISQRLCWPLISNSHTLTKSEQERLIPKGPISLIIAATWVMIITV